MNGLNLFIDLLQAQYTFVNDTTTPELLLAGGRASGKTYGLAYKMLQLAGTHKGGVGIVVVPTLPIADKVFVPVMNTVLSKVDVHSEYERQPRRFNLYFGRKATTIYVVSVEQVLNSAAFAQRLNEWTDNKGIAFFGFEEIDIIDVEHAQPAWSFLMNRLINAPNTQGVAVTTPEGYGFSYQHWVSGITRANSASRRIITCKTSDNPYMSDEFKKALGLTQETA